MNEVYENFNTQQHIYFVAIDLSYEVLNSGDSCGLGAIGFFPMGGDSPPLLAEKIALRNRHETQGEEALGGAAIILASGKCFDRYDVTLHELGHAFGLEHDFRLGLESHYVMSFGKVTHYQMRLSECAAEWLSVSPFFNNPKFDNAPGEIQIISDPTYSADGVRIRFKIADADGLHQAQLLVPEILEYGSWGAERLFGCKRLKGETSTVEFISEALKIEPVDRIMIQIIDVNGSITWATFLTDIDSVLPRPKTISIPDKNLKKAIQKKLGLNPQANITDRDMKTFKSLKLDDSGITNISGLEHATELEHLFLGRNKISNYDSLGQLSKLKRLFLWTNGITDLSVLPQMPQLNLLDLNWNKIRDIKRLSGLKNLHTLSINGNQISDVSPLAELTNLRTLSLTLNQISDVSPLVNLVNLQELRLEGNPVKNHKRLLTLLRRNPDIKIYLKDGGDPLPVTLSYFRAEHTDVGVILKWTTESELNNAGFYIYRSETKNGEFAVVNPTLIQGAGTTSERHTYTWTDTTAKSNVVYYYQIEDISHAGVRKQLATVRMRGYVSAVGKLTTKWGDLKLQE